MGWLGEVFDVFLDGDTPARAWRDKIAAAEHHVRWGLKSMHARDFERALGILDECPDGEPPSPHYAFRRERAAAVAHLKLARLALETYSEQLGKLVEHFQGVEEGRKSLNIQVDAARKHVQQLEAEGSLLSAREERRRLEEMEHEARTLPDLAIEKRDKHSAVHGKHAPTYEEHHDKAVKRLAALRAITDLVSEDQVSRDEAIKRLDGEMSSLEADWKELASAGPAPGAVAQSAAAARKPAGK